MKTQLTKEQSEHLIELGVPANKQSGKEYNSPYGREVFTPTDLLEILPRKIEYQDNYYNVEMSSAYKCREESWLAGYYGIHDSLNYEEETELIDALYDLLLWVIDEGYLKLK